MELAFAALAKVAGSIGLSSAGAAGSAASGVAAGGASIGSGALSVLQGIGATVGVLSKIGAGNAAANASEVAALQADVQEGQAKLQGTQTETRLKQELLRVLGENETATANAGIDITAGIGQQANTAAKKRAASELSISRQQSDMQSALYRLRASGLRSQAKGQRSAGLISAFGAGADYAIDLATRG